MISSLVFFLHQNGLDDLTSEEILDILWLSTYLPRTNDTPYQANEEISKNHTPSITKSEKGNSNKYFPKRAYNKKPSSILLSSTNTGQLNIPGVPIPCPAPPALSRKKEIIKALRPLHRKTPSKIRFVLDNEKTVRQTADQRVLQVFTRPALERTLELDVVVDDSVSMEYWHSVVDELCHLIESTGLFRKINYWSLSTSLSDYFQPVLYARSQSRESHKSQRHPAELSNYSGSRIVLLVSDCVSTAWHNGKVNSIIDIWSSKSLFSLLHLLPKEMWWRTGLRTAFETKLFSGKPIRRNTELTTLRPSLWPFQGEKSFTGIPILSLEPESINNWAKFIIGNSFEWHPGYVFPDISAYVNLPIEKVPDENNPREVLNSFSLSSSDTAFELAIYFSAGMQLNLPVMRLIQKSMLPESEYFHLVEVLLGGILKPIPTQPNEVIDIEKIQFDFVPGVRNLLNSYLPGNLLTEIVSRTTLFLESHTNTPITFQALLSNPDLLSKLEKTNEIKEFARISTETLKRYGGKYADLANKLNELVIKDSSIVSGEVDTRDEDFEKEPEINISSEMTRLDLSDNALEVLPQCFGQLSLLNFLNLSRNKLERLPDTFGQLANLRYLNLSGNRLTDLPSSLSRFEHLEILNLDNNILNPALQSAYKQGLDAVKAYLRSLEQNVEPLYEAKLVLVGEGNVGKTTLLKALKARYGEAPRQWETTTHGVEIDIHGLRLPHPEKDGVEIQLNAWDFGGQDVYRITHQFFFSRRSLYLLVWDPRSGVQQGQVEDWLNMIRLAVGDEARVIIVSTHCKTGGRFARIDKPVFKQLHGDIIVGFHEVDALIPDETTGEMTGVAELKKLIAEHAAELEQMGMAFNRDWKAARDELIARAEPRISYAAFGETCARHGLSQIDADTLAHLMHDLGYIVHYSDDDILRDDVILKPEWLTKAIGFVLEDRAIAESEGILPDARLTQVWRDHPFQNEPRYDPVLYPFFLRLMEKYGISYRLPENRYASLIVQHVPQVRPELPWLPEQEPPENLRRIAMICAMEEDPPGLVPWMIIRTHDYAVEQINANGEVHRLHWQKGMFLSHPPHGEAFLEKRGRELHIYAQAQWPEYFMNVLQHTLQKLITDNWPGMEGRYRFAVPCPEIIDGQPCKGRFNIHALRQFLAEGDSTVRCQECSKKQSIAELLFGFEGHAIDDELLRVKDQLSGLDSRVANYFMATMRAIDDEAKNGPRLFTIRSRDAGLSLKQLFSRPLEIQLWCEAEGSQHPVFEKGKGVYPIDQPRKWVAQIAPYAGFALNVLSTVAPIAAPSSNMLKDAKTADKWDITDQLDLAKAIIDKLPAEIQTSDRALSPGNMLSEPERAGILALHRFLNEVDPTHERLGLYRAATYTGDYRWLCKWHYDAWQPNIPDVIHPHD